MVMNKKERNKVLMFGAIAGLATPFILKFLVMPILNFFGGIVPALSLKLADGTTQAISVSVRDSLTGIDGALSGWLVDAMGLTVTVPFQTYIMAAVGGALLFWLGAMLAEAFNMLKGDAVQKTRVVIFFGSALAAFVIGGFVVPEIGLDLANTLIAFGVNAAILAFVYVWLDKQFKLGLIPF